MQLNHGLTSKNPFVRKATSVLLQLPRKAYALAAKSADYEQKPVVLVNSIPKSGTHLLDQIVNGIAPAENYGSFLSSMTSSFRFRERTNEETVAIIRGFIPNELAKAHLFFHDRFREALKKVNAVHFLIYRDPRDVVVSEARYLAEMNRWHKMHPYFKSSDDPIMLCIKGMSQPEIGFPNIGVRCERYVGWLKDPSVIAVRFEDLVGEQRRETIHGMVGAYLSQTGGDPRDTDEVTERAMSAIDATKSHTFRKGGAGGWKRAFSDDHRRVFEEVGGQLLIELGYETDCLAASRSH